MTYFNISWILLYENLSERRGHLPFYQRLGNHRQGVRTTGGVDGSRRPVPALPLLCAVEEDTASP